MLVFGNSDAKTDNFKAPNEGGVTQGSCQPSSSLSVNVTGTNVVSYVPKGAWSGGTTGVAAVNVEGSSITNTLIPTATVVNSCASNPITGQTVCTANNTDVYVLKGTAFDPGVSPNPLTSAGSGFNLFSGGACTNCGVAMDAAHNKAVIGLHTSAGPGFQFLNLATATFEPAFATMTTPAEISEDPLIDPIRNLLLSATEANNYEIVNVATTTAPQFYENTVPTAGGEARFLRRGLRDGDHPGPGRVLRPVERVHRRHQQSHVRPVHARHARHVDGAFAGADADRLVPFGGGQRARRRTGNAHRHRLG